jgi:hypothetical protein
MKNLLQTHSVSYAESVRIALLAEGIDAVLLDEQSASALGFAGRVRVAIERDEDFDKAERVIRTLQPPTSRPLPSWKWQKWGIRSFGAGLALVIGGNLVDDSSRLNDLAQPMIVAGLVLIASGIVLVVLGPRADRGRDKAGTDTL